MNDDAIYYLNSQIEMTKTLLAKQVNCMALLMDESGDSSQGDEYVSEILESLKWMTSPGSDDYVNP